MIHALPGMGADHRMFPPPWDSLPEFVAHDWPVFQGEQTLAEVAQRLCDLHEIKDGDTVVGASLGGMVGCEVAKRWRLEALVLIGSATSKQEVNRLLARLHPLAKLAPIEWLRWSAGRIPHDLARMFARADASFVERMCEAIFDWDGLGETPVRCLRLHGRSDPIIPVPRKIDLVLDGGHLITMTHASDCVRFIEANC